VFVVAYQNILKLAYVDKFLNEIQLRFRDKYKHEIQSKRFNADFSGFENEFNGLLRECEEEARTVARDAKNPRKYHESDKSTKTMASMMETKKGFLTTLVGGGTTEPLNNTSGKSQKAGSKPQAVKEDEEVSAADSPRAAAAAASSDDNENVVDIEKRMSELMASKRAGGKPKKFEPKR
jgi:signal recognition particle receptor subunit alpha